MYDKKANTYTLLEFIKVNKNSAPSVSKVSAVVPRARDLASSPPSSSSNLDWEVFQLSAIQSLPEGQNPKIPEKYEN